MANTLEIVIKATDKASKEIAGVTKGISGLGSAAAAIGKGIAIGMAGAVTAVTAVGAALGKLAIDAMPLQGIEAAFDGITGASDEMLAALRRGSLGMVTDRELMRNYNQAAQLVSKTFADQLPDAMKYLAKVSAATGQDMGFMLDSLTKGVGRMSPMILDNLGIQVSLEEATAEAAKMFGVEADALSKTQLQAGMMNVVMRALERNTAAMPEIAGTAAQRWAALGVTFKNVKDQIGTALIPVLERGMGVVQDWTNKYLPALVDWFQNKLAPGIGEAWDRLSQFITDLGNGEAFTSALRKALQGVFSEDTVQGIIDIAVWTRAFTSAIKAGDWEEAAGMIWTKIGEATGKAAEVGNKIAEGLREAFAGALGLEEYVWDEFGNLVRGNTSWGGIGTELADRILTGLTNAAGWLEDVTESFNTWATSTATEETLKLAGASLGRFMITGISNIFGDETEAETTIKALDKALGKAFENIFYGAQSAFGTAVKGFLEEIREDIAAIPQAIADWWNVNMFQSDAFTWESMQQAAHPNRPNGNIPGPRPEDAYNFGPIHGGPGATRGGVGISDVGGGIYTGTGGGWSNPGGLYSTPGDILDLSTVPDLVDALTDAIVLEVNRRRRAGENEDGLRAEAPIRDVNLTVYTQSARPEDIQIGVLRGLRAAGVGIR